MLVAVTSGWDRFCKVYFCEFLEQYLYKSCALVIDSLLSIATAKVMMVEWQLTRPDVHDLYSVACEDIVMSSCRKN